MRLLQLIALTLCLAAQAAALAQTNTNQFPREVVSDAAKLIGLEFSDAKIDMMSPGLKDQLKDFDAIRKFPLSNSIPPAILFNPIPVGFKFEHTRKRIKLSSPGKVKLPANFDDLAF